MFLSAYGIFAKRIIQCRSQFGPLYAPVKSTEKYSTGSKSPVDSANKPASPKNISANVDTSLQIPSQVGQAKHEELQQQLGLGQQQTLNGSELLQHNQKEQLMMQNIDGFNDSSGINAQLVSEHYAQDGGVQNAESFMASAVSLDKTTHDELMDMQSSLHPGPYGDASSLQHLSSDYTPQHALDIVTTMPAVSQFDQNQLSVNPDLTLQASIEAGIAPPDGYVNSTEMSDTQMLEHQIAVATQELHNHLSSESTEIPPNSMSLTSANLGGPLQTMPTAGGPLQTMPTVEPSSQPEQIPQDSATTQPKPSENNGSQEKSEENSEDEDDFTYEIKVHIFVNYH